MTLKNRELDPPYMWMAKSDFNSLKIKQQDYEVLFCNHPIWPADVYQKELARIKAEWKGRISPGGGRSEEGELSTLYSAYETVLAQHTMYMAIINQLFGRVYGYWGDIVNDNMVGYCTDEEFKFWLEEYQAAINRNKQLKLTLWDKPVAEGILKKIAHVLENKNEGTLTQLLINAKRN